VPRRTAKNLEKLPHFPVISCLPEVDKIEFDPLESSEIWAIF